MTQLFNAEEYTALTDVVEVYEQNFGSIQAFQQKSLTEHIPPGPVREAVGRRLESGETLKRLKEAVIDQKMGDHLETQEKQVYQMADHGLDYDSIVRALQGMLIPVEKAVSQAFKDDLPRTLRALQVLSKLRAELVIVMGRAFATHRETAVEAEHREIIRELSTPVVEVWEEILIMPLIGLVDTARAKQMMDQLLGRISQLQSRIVILDITGVATVDSEVANHFIRTAQAARLVGAQSILVGISPQVAQTLVRLGVSMAEIETYRDLLSGLKRALTILGYTVTHREPPHRL